MTNEDLSNDVTQEEETKGSNLNLIIIIVVLFVLCICSMYVVIYLFGPAIGNLYDEIIRNI